MRDRPRHRHAGLGALGLRRAGAHGDPAAAPRTRPRLETIAFDLELFEALARGYAAGARDWLSEAEGRLLPLAGPTLGLMNAIRFLADHVAGDFYFRVHREGQNLDRHRAQLTLVRRMLERLPEARRIVAAALGETGRAARAADPR